MASSVVDDRLRRTRRQVKGVDVATALTTLGIGLLCYLIAATVIDHWVIPSGLGFAGRFLLWLVAIVATGVYVALRVVPPLLGRVNPVFAAATIERSEPSLRNSLVNLLLLRGRRQDVAAAVFQAMERQAAADVSKVRMETVVDWTHVVRRGYVLIALLAIMFGYLIFSPKNPIRATARVLMPWAHVEAATRVSIRDVRPGDASVYHGAFVVLSAEITGLGRGERPTVLYGTTDGQIVDQSLPMTRVGDGGRYQCRLPSGGIGIQQDYEYRLVAGDGRTGRYRISVQDAPTAEIERIVLHYPDRVHLPDRVLERQGDVRAMEGTEVTLYAAANTDLKPGSAQVDLGCTGRQGLAMTMNGRKLEGRFTVRVKDGDPSRPEHDCYQIRIADLDGRENPRPIRYRIEVIPEERQEPSATSAAAKDQRAESSQASDRSNKPGGHEDAAASGGSNNRGGSSENAEAGDRGGQEGTASAGDGSSQNNSQGKQSRGENQGQQTKGKPEAGQSASSPERIDPETAPGDAIQEILKDREKNEQQNNQGQAQQQQPSEGSQSKQQQGGGQQGAEQRQQQPNDQGRNAQGEEKEQGQSSEGPKPDGMKNQQGSEGQKSEGAKGQEQGSQGQSSEGAKEGSEGERQDAQGQESQGQESRNANSRGSSGEERKSEGAKGQEQGPEQRKSEGGKGQNQGATGQDLKDADEQGSSAEERKSEGAKGREQREGQGSEGAEDAAKGQGQAPEGQKPQGVQQGEKGQPQGADGQSPEGATGQKRGSKDQESSAGNEQRASGEDQRSDAAKPDRSKEQGKRGAAGQGTNGEHPNGVGQQPGEPEDRQADRGEASDIQGQVDGKSGHDAKGNPPKASGKSSKDQGAKGKNEPADRSEKPSGTSAAKPRRGQSGPTSGGRPGDRSEQAANAEETPPDDINLEYSRRQTTLALEYLRDQLAKEKPSLLDRLGWTKDDARRFLERWDAMRRAAASPGEQGDAARRQLDEALRSLGLRPRDVELRHGGTRKDKPGGEREAGRFAAPKDWADHLRAYTQGVAEGERGKDRR